MKLEFSALRSDRVGKIARAVRRRPGEIIGASRIITRHVRSPVHLVPRLIGLRRMYRRLVFISQRARKERRGETYYSKKRPKGDSREICSACNKRAADAIHDETSTKPKLERLRRRTCRLYSPLFFLRTRYKDEAARVSKGKAGARALSAVSTHNFAGRSRGPERAHANVCNVHTTHTAATYSRALCRTLARSLQLATRRPLAAPHFRPFTTECNFVPRQHTATQHPARQITALFELPGTSKRNKDLGSGVAGSW